MNEDAKKYLELITAPLTTGGVEIVEGQDEKGRLLYVVVPRDGDYNTLIGDSGVYAEALRTIMRAWNEVNGDGTTDINVMVPNPRRIKTQFV